MGKKSRRKRTKQRAGKQTESGAASPPAPPPVIREAEDLQGILRLAGYPMETERDFHTGTMAYSAATFIRTTLCEGTGALPNLDSVGRNDPCPCGSDKKYKKCCMGAAQSPASLRRIVCSPGPMPPGIVPCIIDRDRVLADCQHLGTLLAGHPVLKRIRFGRRRASLYFDEHLPQGHEDLTGEQVAELMEDIGVRYLRTHDESRTFNRLKQALPEAAKTVSTIDELRALVMGHLFAELEMGPGNEPPQETPLGAILFKLTVGETAERDRTMADLAGQMAARLQHSAGAEGEDGAYDSETPEELLERNRDLLGTLVESTLQVAEEMAESIEAGTFPVLLPFALIAEPFMTATVEAQNEPGLPRERVRELIVKGEEDFCDEDSRLYQVALEQWLEKEDGSDPDATEHVRLMLSFLKSDGPGPLMRLLLVTTLDTCDTGGIDWEEELNWPQDNSPITAELLESYGDKLLENGFPKLAVRMWKTCGLLGPIPKALQEKIDRTEPMH